MRKWISIPAAMKRSGLAGLGFALAFALFAAPRAEARMPCGPANEGQARIAHHAGHGLPVPMPCCASLATLPVALQTACNSGSRNPAAASPALAPFPTTFAVPAAPAGFPETTLPRLSYYARSMRILR